LSIGSIFVVFFFKKKSKTFLPLFYFILLSKRVDAR